MDSKGLFVPYIKGLPYKVPVIEFDRSALDFEKPADFKKLTDQIEATD